MSCATSSAGHGIGSPERTDSRGGAGWREDSYSGRTGTGFTYIAVEEIDALYERARSKDADVVTEIHDTDYGSRDFSVRDPEGNVWSFGTYRPSA